MYAYFSMSLQSNIIKIDEIDWDNMDSTLSLFNVLFKEVSKLVPDSWKARKGERRGLISEPKLNKVLGFGTSFIKTKLKLIESGKYPEYMLSVLQINSMITNLEYNFGTEARKIIDIILNYKKLNNNLKETPKQQWHIHNPNLDAHYFDRINSVEKAFWFGFLCADAYVKHDKETKVYTLNIEIAHKDKKLLYNFCNVLGLEFSNVKNRDRELKGYNVYRMSYIAINCKPLVNSLIQNEIIELKNNRIGLPKFYTIGAFKGNRKLLLAWLRGYYEGDGTAQTTSIVSVNYKLLDNIKKELSINYKIGISVQSSKLLDIDGNIHDRKRVYRLALGAGIFNEMTSICKLEGVQLLKRKDHIAFDHYEVYNKFKEHLASQGIDIQKLQDLVLKLKKKELQTIFGVSRYLLNKIISEWNIKAPPRGYWSTIKEKKSRQKF